MTMLHLAEALAGRRRFRRWANDRQGRGIQVESVGCSNGFGALDAPLAGLALQTMVADSHWRVFPAARTLAAASALIRARQEITVCANPAYARCSDALRGGPLL